MGSNYCIQYCRKNVSEPNSTTNEKKQTINKISSSYSSFPQYNYNNFAKKFNSKLHYLGKYFDISEFHKIIPKNA